MGILPFIDEIFKKLGLVKYNDIYWKMVSYDSPRFIAITPHSAQFFVSKTLKSTCLMSAKAQRKNQLRVSQFKEAKGMTNQSSCQGFYSVSNNGSKYPW